MKIIELSDRATRLILQAQSEINHLQQIIHAYIRVDVDLGDGQWKLSGDAKSIICLDPEELGPRAIDEVKPDDGAA